MNALIDIDNLIAKYLSRNASEQEVHDLNTWINEQPDHLKYFETMQQTWEKIQLDASKNSTINIDQSWLRLQNKIKQLQPDNNPITKISFVKRIQNSIAYKAAALVLLGLGVAFSVYYYNYKAITKEIALDQVRTKILSDGSEITLNKNSELDFPKHFSGASRTVTLKGEAFFNIQHNPSKPFIIKVNGLEVKVLGTSFNIKTKDDKTIIVVETGKVLVSNQHDSIYLTPQQMLSVDSANFDKRLKTVQDNLYQYYRTNEFDCINVSLERVAEVLSEAYKVPIVIENPEIKTLKFTTKLPLNSLDQNLDIIAETLQIKVEYTNSKIVLR